MMAPYGSKARRNYLSQDIYTHMRAGRPIELYTIQSSDMTTHGKAEQFARKMLSFAVEMREIGWSAYGQGSAAGND